MIESQAHRTLVKSPPELWAEVSDPAALARHLGEIASEIRITRVEPEHSVAWEGDQISGRVELAPSGWGTKVSLTLQAQASREEGSPEVGSAAIVPAPATPVAPSPGVPQEVPQEVLPQAAPDPDPASVGSGEVAHSAPVMPAPATAEAESLALSPDEGSPTGLTATADSGTDTDAPLSVAPARAGFFARLIGRLTGRPSVAPETATPSSPSAEHPYRGIGRPSAPSAPAVAAEAEPQSEPAGAPAATGEAGSQARPELQGASTEAVEPTTVPATEASPAPEEESPAPGAPGEPALDSERAAAALAAVLDSLGSAHHRPFSRS